MSDFNFVVKYRPGKVNIDSDYLSRNALSIDDLMKSCSEVCKPQCVMSAMSITSSKITCSVPVSKLSLPVDEAAEVVKKEELVDSPIDNVL